MTYYPDNTTAHFTSKLPEYVRLDGDYEVGLSELIEPHNWLNFDNTDSRYWFGVLSEDGIEKFPIKSGYCKNEMEFADSLTEQAARAIAPLDPDLSMKFAYETTNKFATGTEKISEIHGQVAGCQLQVHGGGQSVQSEYRPPSDVP
jgi:hypothetical protein